MSAESLPQTRRSRNPRNVSGPSLKQTVEWLKENLPLQLMIAGEEKLEPLSFRGCTLTWRSRKKAVGFLVTAVQDVTGDHTPQWEDTFERTITLADLDPTAVGPSYLKSSDGEGPWKVFLSTTSGESTIRSVRFSETGLKGDEKWSDVGFDFKDEESALKVANAFRRAIELCGGRKSPRPKSNLFDSAPEWKSIGSASDSKFYMNTRTIKPVRPQGTLQVWVKNILIDQSEAGRGKVIKDRDANGLPSKGFEAYSESIALWECDCSGRRIRLLSNTDYDERGVVLSTITAQSEWSPALPDSIGESILSATCKLAQSPRTPAREK